LRNSDEQYDGILRLTISISIMEENHKKTF
jgi:hypothetical protein